MTNPSEFRTTPFADAGVWVSAPAAFTVTLTPVEVTPEMQAAQSDFEIVRVVGNLKFQGAGKQNQGAFRFDSPARLQARPAGPDVAAARQRGKRLIFAWWNGTRWVPFERGSTVVTQAQADDQYFDITDFVDPPIAWGT